MKLKIAAVLSALALLAASQVHAGQGASGGMPSKTMQTESPPPPPPAISGIITPPRALTSHIPPSGTYPLLSQLQNEQGDTLLLFTVKEDGSVSDVVVEKSSDYARLDAAAIEMAKTWRYQPATKDGKPLAVKMRTRVIWKLTDDPLDMLRNSPFVIVTMKPEDYPADAKAQNQEGLVVIVMSLDEDGLITSSTIVRSSNVPSLDAAALEFATRRWHVKPATADGKSIKTLVGLAVVWSLSGK